MTKRAILAAAMAALLSAGSAYGLTDEEKCNAGRLKAKGNFNACVAKTMAKLPSSTDIYGKTLEKLNKCVAKYAATWEKLRALVDSTSCSGLDRFVDNGTTVTDRLTLLTWVKMSGAPDGNYNFADLQDPDNTYNISFSADDNGSAYGDFFAGLNAYPGFDNARSWRMPSLPELLTVSSETVLGAALVGPTATTTLYQGDASQIWIINPSFGVIEVRPKWGAIYVRAVRGGL